MSSRVTINVGFYFEKQHYVQTQGYIPRTEAQAIPHLRIQDRPEQPPQEHPRPGRQPKQEPRREERESEEEMSEEEEVEVQEMELEEVQGEMEGEVEEGDDMDADQQNEVERALEELQEENYDSLESSQEDDLELDSLSGEPMKAFNNTKTKRQKGEIKDLVQLPDRRPRKDKKLDEATEIIRREEKERKRKQYLKKQIEAQEKATLEKILNETGRKLRLREEKEMQDEIDREQKVFRTLGHVPKIITLRNENGLTVMTHRSTLFPTSMTKPPQPRMGELCSHCPAPSKYNLRNGLHACSLPCYRAVAIQ